MDIKHGNTTRAKLLATARELFITKGVDRVGVREIATKAGVNLSLMNYYFQSKENLLDQIFEVSIKEIASKQKEILNSEKSLEDKIREFVYSYIDFLCADPMLVSFVLSILHRNSGQSPNLKSVEMLYNSDYFARQIKIEVEMGTIKPLDPEQLYVSMVSLILFPFSIKPLIMGRIQATNAEMTIFFESRKEHIFEMIMSAIRK